MQSLLLITPLVTLSTDLIGNFHPLLVHLPIGIFLFGFALEVFIRIRKIKLPPEVASFTLFTAAGFALFSVISGLVLGNGGGYDIGALKLHRNMGIAFTLWAFILIYIQRSRIIWVQKSYLLTYAIGVILLSITGHFGGNITHGEGFLLGNMPVKTVVAVEDLETALLYEDLVQPVLEAKCVSCHNNNKTEGGLLMTSPEMLLKGGEHGPVLTAEKDSIATLIKRIHLDPHDELHMPPKNKAQLSAQEITLLDWWVANKACFNCQVGALPKSNAVSLALNAFKKDNSPLTIWASELEAVPNSWIKNVRQLGIGVSAITKGNPLLIVNVKGKKELTKTDFKTLKKYALNIVELNLGNSNMNDTLAVFLPEFEHLLKLQLPQTQITDQSLKYIASLAELQSFNAFNTPISEKALGVLDAMPKLERAYLTDTQIDKQTLKAYTPKSKTLRLEFIPEETFAQTTLEPPTIISNTDFFKDSLEVALAYVFDNATLYYTTDGSTPDTTSTKYTTPFTLKETSVLKAITYMEGWGVSEIASADFKKSSLSYNTVTLLAKPNEKYAANGGASLVDLKRGSTNFVDGMWLGFEGMHSGANITLEKKEKIHTVSVGALSAPASWIFYPIGIEVYSAANGKDYELVSKKSFSPEEPNNDVKKKFFDVKLPQTHTQHLKIVVKSPLTNPAWHPNPGGKSWLFIDEIILE